MLKVSLWAATIFALAVSAKPLRNSDQASCATNAECLFLGLPLLPPTRTSKRATGVYRRVGNTAQPTQTYSVSGSYQYNVPMAGYYYITATGAAGGDSRVPGGLAAKASVAVYLDPADQVTLFVGQRGAAPPDPTYGGGGGGGSFVYVNGAVPTPLIAVGGGGGGGSNYQNVNAQGNNNAQLGPNGASGDGNAGSGGTNEQRWQTKWGHIQLSLIHISEPTRPY